MNITGMIYIMVFIPGMAVLLTDAGFVQRMERMVVTVISRVKRLTWSPYMGIVNGRSRMESYVERSWAHRNFCWRSSMEVGKNLNMAYRIGNCSSMGRQP